MDMGKE